ncbi:hypothetical protein H4J42_06995, partial [Colwellia sp. BRX8-8]|nr:hypothetical protein [Colwellia sp. BRX8-8]
MSVINQMLKDLDQRKAEQQGSSDFTVPVSSASLNKKTVFIGLLMIILLNICGIFVWQMYVENQTLKMSNSSEINRVGKKAEQNQVVINESLAQPPNSTEPVNMTKNSVVASKQASLNNNLKREQLIQVDLNQANLAETLSQNITTEEALSKIDAPETKNSGLVN